MIATCPKCRAQFNIQDSKIPDSGARMRCLKCKEIFQVKKPSSKKTYSEKNIASMNSETKKKPQKQKEEDGEEEEEEEDEPGGDPDHVCKGGAPLWIVTFADLSTLMLTFFVLLLSFANMDVVKFRDMLGSVQEALGTGKNKVGQDNIVMIESKRVVMADKLRPNFKEDSNPFDGISKNVMTNEVSKSIKNIATSKNISVTPGDNGVRVLVKGAYFFDGGSASLKKESIPFMENIAKMMKKFPYKLRVEGHTDNIPISTPQFPSNWELSAVRATTVLRYLIEEKGIDRERITATGYGDTTPLESNETREGRAKNRRVEFIFSK